ncbi:tyrosine--tRNA ligase [Mycoplasmopsis sturni]|uniref:tyrosine--tRNA ligase n=1 Tax=Mycoplasmopsis sturni TaxID=39047 RepID=UPI0005600389|nr:tyrosine--tRNA ligase [Mycoplasmopsis sturni]
MNIVEELKLRGIFKDISNYEKFVKLPKEAGVYVGFDPTAQSLHLGNYIQIVNLLRFKKHGYKTIAILGGATGMIGDPSFKDAERQLLDHETLLLNKNKIKQQLEKFGIQVIDNYDFYKDMSIIDFLRNVGKLVNVSYMLSKDSVSKRIEKGLSFTEFSYQLIQGWDFAWLYKQENVCIQFGGSDQWGNITTGLDMIGTLYGKEHKAVAITANLLTDSSGNKFGKSTGGGSLWLDQDMTKPYQMYQFLLNQPDSEVEKLLKWLTFLSVEEIEAIIKQHKEHPQNKLAQKSLAFEVIKDIHSELDANNAILVSELLFNKNLNFSELNVAKIESVKEDLPTIKLNQDANLIESLISSKLLQSKREAREFLATHSIKWNYQNATEDTLVESPHLNNQYGLVHVGKKKIFLVEIIKK